MPKRVVPPPVEPRQVATLDELDSCILKLDRRIQEVEALDVAAAVLNKTGADVVARSNVRETIRDVFGSNSPEFREHEHIEIWAGPMFLNMHDAQIAQAKERGKVQVVGILRGLIGRLRERREDLAGTQGDSTPSTYFELLNLHPRILGRWRSPSHR